MRAAFRTLVDEATAARRAVGAFTCYDLEACFAVLQAAEAAQAPAVILVSRQSFAAGDGERLVAALCAAAARSPVPVCVQLDHVDDLALIAAALEAGVGVAMADGSALPMAENVAFVRAAAALARRHDATVEAELGGISGDEDVATAVAAGALTEPGAAERFVEQTGAACLAVSIGNVHGHYREPPALDFERLTAIRDRVAVPLSLHGASGIPDGDVRRAIGLGIAKVNVNTELREAYLQATETGLTGALKGARVLELHTAQTAAVADVVAAKLRLCAGATPD
jgi:tagatose 1,6-diphosphate aldolase GatY/KbaY